MGDAPEVHADDVIVVAAMRVRRAVDDEGLDDLIRAFGVLHGDDKYVAAVTAMPLQKAYERGAHDLLQSLGLTFEHANDVVPVVVERG